MAAGFWTLAICVYVLIAGFTFYMTYREERWQGLSNPLFRFVRYALCLVWPLLVVAVFIAVWRRPATGIGIHADQ